MTGTMDPKSNFTLVILQTELERFKFLVRSFLRARIAKVLRTGYIPAQCILTSHTDRQVPRAHPPTRLLQPRNAFNPGTAIPAITPSPAQLALPHLIPLRLSAESTKDG